MVNNAAGVLFISDNSSNNTVQDNAIDGQLSVTGGARRAAPAATAPHVASHCNPHLTARRRLPLLHLDRRQCQRNRP